MTLAVATPFVSYAGNGSLSTFSFPFPVFVSSQLLVTVTDSSGNVTTLNLSGDYTVSGLNAAGTPASSGSITLVNSNQIWLTAGGNLATGFTLIIAQNVDTSQPNSIRNQGDFFRWFLEDALDRIMMVIQRIGSQALVLPPGINPSSFSPILPTNLPENAGKVLLVDPTGTKLILGTPTTSVISNPLPTSQGGTGASQTMTGGRIMQSSSPANTIIESIVSITAGIQPWSSSVTYSSGDVVKNTANAGFIEFYSSRVNANLNNSLPSQSTNSNWQFLFALSLASGIIIPGTTTNDSAAAGIIGEAMRQYNNVGPQNVAASVTWQNADQLVLTAGDWDVSGNAYFTNNGSTNTTTGLAISVNSGNTTTDHALGDNVAAGGPAANGVPVSLAIPAYRLSINSNTTVYLKVFVTFSAGTPQFQARISARRVR